MSGGIWYVGGMTNEAAIAVFINGMLGVAYQQWWPETWWPKYINPHARLGMVKPKSLTGQEAGDGSIADKWGGSLDPVPKVLEDLRPVKGKVLQDGIEAGDVTQH